MLTSDKDWDPTLLNCEGGVNVREWVDVHSSLPNSPNDKDFAEAGNYRHRTNLH